MKFSDHPQHVQALIDAALVAADPALAVQRATSATNSTLTVSTTTYPITKNIYLIAVGKAALTMGRAMLKQLNNRCDGGVFIAKAGSGDGLPPAIRVFFGEHPVPAAHNVAGAKAIGQLLANTKPDDLVICLISGGASALLTDPLVEMDEWQTLNEALLASGCTIAEFNTVRTALDPMKGGGLARLAAPAKIVSLILSDVVDGGLHIIGSGPTVVDFEPRFTPTAVLQKYGLEQQLSAELYTKICAILNNQPTQVDGPPPIVQNLIVGDLKLAANAAAQKAIELGFDTEIVDLTVDGEAGEFGRKIGQKAIHLKPNSCHIYGGETTVTLKPDHGRGGRNQAIALAAALAIDGQQAIAITTLATDGEDGPTDSAGATVTGHTVQEAHTKNLDPFTYLDTQDSYNFFKQLKTGHLRFGSTGTNVNDLVFIMTYE